MQSSRQDDPAGPLVWIIIILSLCMIAFLLAVGLIGLVGVYIFGFLFTLMLVAAIDGQTRGKLGNSPGLMFLVMLGSCIFWGGVAWWLFPIEWVLILSSVFSKHVDNPALVLLIGGGVLGLSWSSLSLAILGKMGMEGDRETVEDVTKEVLKVDPEELTGADSEGGTFDQWDERVILGDDF